MVDDRERELSPQVSPSAAIEAFAGGQYGAFSYSQALSVGGTSALIHRRCRQGSWERVEPRVYRVERYAPSWEQALAAALLGAGENSVISHRAAARLWQLDGATDKLVELTVPPSSGYRRHMVHRTNGLATVDLEVVRALRTTSLARTLVDYAAVAGRDAIEIALESALRRGLSLARLYWRLDAAASMGRPGIRNLRAVLAKRPAGIEPTESELETRFLQLIRRWGLPDPVRQFVLRDGRRFVARIDLAYPEHRIAVELDGFSWHSSRTAFVNDRNRQNRLVLLGWTVLRFTWPDVVDNPESVTTVLDRALAA